MFFFFKQKTAYEMRISDWSSDVCSSDLRGVRAAGPRPRWRRWRSRRGSLPTARGSRHGLTGLARVGRERPGRLDDGEPLDLPQPGDRGHEGSEPGDEREGAEAGRPRGRSEEHTSELQSLMRISYAVFCLKKKKK